jgi:hypothetical protein
MKESLDGFLKAMGMDRKMLESDVLAKWFASLDEGVQKRIEKKYIKNEILYLEFNSSVMRDEMMHKRSKLVQEINALAGLTLISDIYLA